MSNRGILDADLSTLSGWLSGGLRWWMGELADLVPQTMRDWAAARRKLADYRPDTGEILVRFDPDAGYPRGTAPVAVILPQGFCLTRTIERPMMNQRDLESMVALECDRILPLARGEAVLGARILTRDDAHRRMTVEVAAIPNRAAQDLAAALGRLPCPCLAVYHQSPEPGRQPPIDFLRALRRTGLVGSNGPTATGLWLAVAVLFAVNLGVLIWRDVASVDALSDIVMQQQPAITTAQRMKARIALFDSQVNRTSAQRRTGEPLAVLSDIATALPPGVWLQRFSWAGDSLRIVGYRPTQADVSAALRRAGFSVSRYSETATTGASRLGQPFEITLRMKKP